MRVTRRAVIGSGACAAATLSGLTWAAEPPSDVTFAQDFDECWRTLAERYCYFGEKRTDWNRVRALYRPRAVAAEDHAAFGAVIALMLAELYDAHTHVSDPPEGSPRWAPYDLLVEPAGDAALVVATIEGAVADAGIVIGDRILALDGVPIATVAAGLAPRCLVRPDPAATLFALNTAVAGRRKRPRSFTVQSARGVARTVAVPLPKAPPKPLPDLEYRRLPSGYGYIVIRSFGDDTVVDAFDAALLTLRDTPGLIIDVRDNGGGDTAVARPIMGRFITQQRPYARMRRRAGRGLGPAWTEYVEPRGPFTYTAPVIVLSGRWSGSMAEGFPMGMRGIGRARVVGTPMMGLGAAVFPLTLDRTGLRLQYSAEPVYDVADRPRSAMRPDLLVPDGADALAAAVGLLARGA